MLTRKQRRRNLDAIRAAIHRTYRGLTQIEFDITLRATWSEIECDKHGHLLWRSSKLGKRLFICLAESQNWRCCYCCVPMVMRGAGNVRLATLEHIMPKCLGGTDHPDNLAIACVVCNNDRGALLGKLLELGETRKDLHRVLEQDFKEA